MSTHPDPPTLPREDPLHHPSQAADAQQRYLSKQEAFGAGSGKADSPAALCTVALAGYEHSLPGACSLTVRKVRALPSSRVALAAVAFCAMYQAAMLP